MTVKDILPSHPVEIMVRTNYPESLLPYLSSETRTVTLSAVTSIMVFDALSDSTDL